MSESSHFNTSHVSINLTQRILPGIHYEHFNTSHVSINLAVVWAGFVILWNFNTSHVSINLTMVQKDAPCSADFNTSHVSINRKFNKRIHKIMYISIHLMFLLIIFLLLYQHQWSMISIHLMFLLIGIGEPPELEIYHFNTSHVSINR